MCCKFFNCDFSRLLRFFRRIGCIRTLILLSTIHLAYYWTLTTSLSTTHPAIVWTPTTSLSTFYPAISWTQTAPLFRIDSGTKMSIQRCCVPNCNKTRADNTILHIFPNPDKDLNRFNMWIRAIGGDILTLDHNIVFGYRRVCHMHFEPQYHTRSKRLSPNAVPTLQLSEASTSRHPLGDVTQRTINEMEYLSTSQSAPPLQANQHVGMPEQSARQTSAEPVTTVPVEPTPSTSKGENQKRHFKYFSPDVKVLGEEIKKLRNAKNTITTKLKKALTLTQNKTFQKTLQKFTTAAVIFTMLQFREAGKPITGRRFKKEEKVMALALYKQGPRAYRWLRKFFTLPSPLTLSRMIRVAALRPGINENIFKQLKKNLRK